MFSMGFWISEGFSIAFGHIFMHFQAFITGVGSFCGIEPSKPPKYAYTLRTNIE